MNHLISLALVLLASFTSITTVPDHTSSLYQDTQRLKELDAYWAEVSRTVREGDFEGYSALYHDDAVVIFATNEPKSSMAISEALAGWKSGFEDTKAGKVKANVEFRFSQRLGNKNTAHDTGAFTYSTENSSGQKMSLCVAFEMLFVKKNGKWLGVMEYQKDPLTKAEWDALK